MTSPLCQWQSTGMESVAEMTDVDGRALLAEFLAGKKQAEFAEKFGCSGSHLSLILKGKRAMSFALAKRVSAETGIPVETLPHEKAAP